jgi:hypothetical protein
LACALLPIAYYLYCRQPPDNWLAHPQFAADRESIRSWLVRSLLKASGIWGSGLDTLLTALRDIKESHNNFPTDALEKAMAKSGKSLAFGPEEIEDLLDIEYGDRRVFPLLSMLYSFIDVRQLHHMDHVFPKKYLRRQKLKAAGCDDDVIAECRAVRDRLGNLQLLEGHLNVLKSDCMPSAWLEQTYPDRDQRNAVADRHDLGEAPRSSRFPSFFEGAWQ